MIYGLKLMDGQEHLLGVERSPVECFCCGYCCVGYNPLVNEEEVERMADYLELSKPAFKRQYIDETLIGYLLRQDSAGCVFLRPDGDSGKAYCAIHPARPDVCREWTPSLWRPECLEGLARLSGGEGRVLPAARVYEDPEQMRDFVRALKS